jgi:O-acetyl-ADP-ribose deacetylase (regulator of RNase III)
MQTKNCFVIMPFGEKTDVDGAVVPFDTVYEHILEPAGKELEKHGIIVKSERCDKIKQAGWIHSTMIKHIMEADIAIVDVTTANPNVFYELGVRHALKRKVTILVRRKGTKLPFNIEGFKVIDYDLQINVAKEAIKEIAEHMRKGIEADETDSLVHQVLSDLKVQYGESPASANLEIQKSDRVEYRLQNAPQQRIAIITGDLRSVRGIDVWVNAENTNMQMARFYDRSMSGIVRYYGARKNQAGHVIEDVIANELAAAMENTFSVPPGHVIATGAGELARQGVKRILHAAAVEGAVGGGYRPIQDVAQCVRNALEKADQDLAAENLRSILFPLLGTGTGAGNADAIAKELLLAAITYLGDHPSSNMQTVAFLAQRRDQLEALNHALGDCPGLEFVPAATANT